MLEKPLQTERKSSQKPSVYSFLGQKRRFSRRHRAGFSLIEMLVAISIIGILVSIGTVVGVRMTAAARVEQVRSMMLGALSANTEYKAVRKVGSIGVDASSGDFSSSEQYVRACRQIGTVEEMLLSALNSSNGAAFERTFRDADNDGVPSIFDRWGTELEYRPNNNGSGSGPVTNVDNDLLPNSRDPFFASAGPDTEWGTEDDITTVTQP